MPVKHKKTDTIPNWTQAELDAQIALGNYPPGTLLANIVLPGDWNDDHNVSVSVTEINATGTPSASTWLRGDGVWAGNPLGDVTGPAAATDNAIAVYSGITGKQIKNSTALVSTTGTLILAGQASPTYVAGGLAYDTGKDCWTAFNSNSAVSLQIGRETWSKCLNNSGVAIPNGAAVTVTGSSGGLPTIALALATTGVFVLGLATQAIANGAMGEVTTYGDVNGVDTSTFTAGAVLYVSSTVAGSLVTASPVAPNFRIRVGTVGVVSATVGTIIVNSPTTTLGNGAANQVMGMNAAGTAPEYKTLNGTAARLSVTQAANSVTFNIDPTYVGQATITTLGTIATGVWNGTNIAVNKIAAQTASRAAVYDATGFLAASAATAGEVAFLSGVTSAIQGQLNAKQGTLTLTTTGTSGAATLVGNTLNIPNYATAGGSGTVTSVGSGNGLTGGPITASGSLSVLADNSGAVNSALRVASTGVRVNIDGAGFGRGLSVDSSGIFFVAGGGLRLTNPISVGDIISAPIELDNINLSGDVTGASTGGNTSVVTTIAAGAVTNAKIAAAAGISLNKLAATTASRLLVSDASGFVSASAVTAAEAAFLSGVTSNIQTQLNAKAGGTGTATGTNTGDQTITLTGEATGTGTGSFAVTLTNAAVIGKAITGYVSGAGTVAATDTILQAINKLNGNTALKANTASPTFTGTVTAPTVNVSGLTASQSVQTDASKNLVSLANTGSGNNVLGTAPAISSIALSGTHTGASSFAALQTMAAGINVGNTAQASATTLDWYEEGTFTPTYFGSTTAGATTYSTQVGVYTRVGNMVFIAGVVGWTGATGTGSGRIGGMPFTANGATYYPMAFLNNNYATAAGGSLNPAVAPGSTYIELFYSVAASGSFTAAPMDTVAIVYFGGVYFV